MPLNSLTFWRYTNQIIIIIIIMPVLSSAKLWMERDEINTLAKVSALCSLVSDIAIFVLKRDIKLQLTN